MEQSFTLTTMVSDAMTAQYVKSGDLPVLGTPVLIALMEQAAATYLKTFIAEGQTSVGTEITVKHLSATPITDTIKIQAVLIERDERKASFSLQAWDSGGLIAEGSHTRAIVAVDRFMERAKSKLSSL